MIDMTPSLALLILVGVLVGTGTVLVLERSLSRIIIGASLITYGVNVLILMAGGRAGAPPLLGQAEPEDMSDPLPQAFVLTAIVIGLALTAFVLTMSYRTWQLNGDDEVQDDREDRRIAIAAAHDEIAARATDDAGESLAEAAESVFDETTDEQVERTGTIPAVQVEAEHDSPPTKQATAVAQADAGAAQNERGASQQ